MNSRHPVSIEQAYRAELAAKGYQSDPAQLRAVAALQRCADDWVAYKARRLPARRGRAWQELFAGLLFHRRARQAQGAVALSRVHARSAPRTGAAAGHGEPAPPAGRAHGPALQADLLR